MKRIFVDFEMNPVDKKYGTERKVCGREIIEIGAVMLDEDFVEIDEFKLFIKPEYNSHIYSKYEELTGIKTGNVVGEDTFRKSYAKFIKWCGSDYEVYAWSNSDKSQIEKEMLLKGVEMDESYKYMFEHWIDFQKIFGEIVNSEQLISLENALNSCGILFSGRKHDALFDARNTSKLFIESKACDLSKCIETIREYISKETSVAETTLGELFDFTSLGLQLV